MATNTKQKEDQTTGVQKSAGYDLVASVQRKVDEYVNKGELNLPPDYSVGNALKSAYLILQGTVDKEKTPVLQACTKESIANALLDMAVQGLNPGKKQCDFIAYGKKLTCQREYYGTIAVAKRVDPKIDEVFAEPIYGGDELEYEINYGRKVITQHKQKFENIRKDNITGAYCIITYKDGKTPLCELMTFEQIKQSWKKSPVNPVNADGTLKQGTTHHDYPDRMARRTVINRLCVPIINASADGHLFLESFNRANEIATEYEVEQEIEQNANTEYIDAEAIGGSPEKEPVPEVACPKCGTIHTDPNDMEAIEMTGQCLYCHQQDEQAEAGKQDNRKPRF